MKTVILEYGKSVLAVVAVLLILGIVGVGAYSVKSGDGVLGQMETQAKQGGIGDGAREQSSFYQSILGRKKPVIIYQDLSVCAGDLPDWNNMFLARDEEGHPLEVQIQKINGNKENLLNYRFPISGIYEIEVSAEDDYGVSTRQIFQIPVQRAPLGKGQNL